VARACYVTVRTAGPQSADGRGASPVATMSTVLLTALNTRRDLARLHEIASVLIRHGLGDLVRRLGLGRLLERAGRSLHSHGADGFTKEPEVHLREALEELGPTFVKIGQLLAGRSDLLPPAWTEELSRLHERAAPVPYDELREQLVEDLGAEPDEVFRDFDPTPLAAASIAQVHRASLPSGEPVVLKIRRPGLRAKAEADLRLLARLAEQAEQHVPEVARFQPKNLVRELSRSLRAELDLRVEAGNAERLRAKLPDGSCIVIPRIHRQWSSERLCVMDYLDGPSVGRWLREREPGGHDQGERDPAQVAALGAEAMLRMVFVDGVYHADPHPGNVLLLADGKLGLVDFGLVGYLSEARRMEFLDLLLATASRRVDDMVDTLLSWSSGDVDVHLLGQDCAAFIDRYHGLPLGRLDVGALLGDLTALMRENDLFLPTDVALLLKVFVTLEGLGRRLDPDFEMASYVEPFARDAWREHHSPSATVRRGAREVGTMLATLPRDLHAFANRVRRGRIRVEVDMAHLDQFGSRLDRSANRVTVGLITAALIVGTAISLTLSGGPRVFDLPAFGLLAFMSSMAAGVWLLWSILRSGHQ